MASTCAFICETSIFSYLGLAIFSFKHQVEWALVIWSIALCLIGRAANIFPLTWMVNKFRATKITSKMSFIMWFSGLRGAISYALSLHLEYSKEETRRVVITTTLIIVLFTTVSRSISTAKRVNLHLSLFNRYFSVVQHYHYLKFYSLARRTDE